MDEVGDDGGKCCSKTFFEAITDNRAQTKFSYSIINALRSISL